MSKIGYRRTVTGPRGLIQLHEVDAALERARDVRREALISDSKIASLETKKILADAVVDLVDQLRHVRDQIVAGTVSADESRSIPGVVNQIRKCLEMLGLGDKTEDEINL